MNDRSCLQYCTFPLLNNVHGMELHWSTNGVARESDDWVGVNCPDLTVIQWWDLRVIFVAFSAINLQPRVLFSAQHRLIETLTNSNSYQTRLELSLAHVISTGRCWNRDASSTNETMGRNVPSHTPLENDFAWYQTFWTIFFKCYDMQLTNIISSLQW